MTLLSLALGSIVGLSLGLTGGGGAIFAVPLLVYGLGVEPRDAVGISLAAVAVTAAVGFWKRWRGGLVEVPTGLLFAVAGMAGAPVGSWLSGLIPQQVLLLLFAVLMLLVAYRMWQRAGAPPTLLPEDASDATGPACRRDATGRLRLTSPCAMVLAAVGLGTGVLAGLFGVGGGFVIVPALVGFSGMPIHRAIGTSLMVIALVGVSGVASHLLAGRDVSLAIAAPFIAGGVLGMFAGIAISGRLSGPRLQRVFAASIVAVATFVIIRSTWQG